MSEIDILKATEKLGKEAEILIQSELGRYLNGAFLQDIERAKEDLLNIDPYSFKSLQEIQVAISELQHKANLAISMQNYLAEIVTNGQQATHQLEAAE